MLDERNTLLEAVDGFTVAMLSTLSPEGVLHSRPMTVAKREGSVLWFATAVESDTADDVRTIGHANASFQSTFLYLSITGEAKIVRDREKIRELWKDSWAAWFPNGPEDPDLALVRLEGRSGDIWDLRGTNGVKAAVQIVSAIIDRSLGTDGASNHVSL